MKTAKLIAAFFVLVLVLNASGQNPDFRNSNWGMDSAMVKRYETASFIDSKNNSLVFSGKLSNLDAKIVYDFTASNQLYQAFYLIRLNSKTPSLYVKYFQLFQELITKKYSEPLKKSAFTINGKAITPDEWASNLISDNLNLETKWKTEKTDIDLFLYSINDELYIEIRYASLDYTKKADEEKKVEILKSL
ncbi:MAG: hypothetical protein WCK34_01630 [Bacteroidota bacterium]